MSENYETCGKWWNGTNNSCSNNTVYKHDDDIECTDETTCQKKCCYPEGTCGAFECPEGTTHKENGDEKCNNSVACQNNCCYPEKSCGSWWHGTENSCPGETEYLHDNDNLICDDKCDTQCCSSPPKPVTPTPPKKKFPIVKFLIILLSGLGLIAFLWYFLVIRK